jgi:hypothetical protein
MPTGNVHERFKAYLLTIVLRSYFDLVRTPAMQPLCRVLRDAILKGDDGCGAEREHAASLWSTLNRMDRNPFLRYPDWDELLTQAENRTRA